MPYSQQHDRSLARTPCEDIIGKVELGGYDLLELPNAIVWGL